MNTHTYEHTHRDTMSFATKLCHTVRANGDERDVMKTPKSSSAKVCVCIYIYILYVYVCMHVRYMHMYMSGATLYAQTEMSVTS